MFDLSLPDTACEVIEVQPPPLDEPWQIGMIVGPSGSGKSTLAQRLFGASLSEPPSWPAEAAVLDGFDARLSIRQITRTLTAVGFSSPPAWIKPYHVLSTGERFRCDLARVLAEAGLRGMPAGLVAEQPPSAPEGEICAGGPLPMVVFDEFTSVVDRQVARFGSAAVAKALRGGQIGCRFVAVTCHYDVIDWLQPDWVLDMADGRLSRRRLRRRPIELELFRCQRAAWRLFARHHYLSGELPPAVRCFLAVWGQQPVAFCATLPLLGRGSHWRVARLVVLPDFQGLGIGLAVAEAVCQLHRGQGDRINLTSSHPSVVAQCRRSPRWRTVAVRQAGSRPTRLGSRRYCGSAGRAVASFEFVG